MATYPVRIHPKPYRGKKQHLQFDYQQKIEVAAKLEDYLNKQMANSSIRLFTYYEIAEDLHLHENIVRELLFAVDGGHNGITVSNPNIKDGE